MTMPTDVQTASASWADVLTLRNREYRSGWFQVDAQHLELFDRASYTEENPHEMSADAYPEGLLEGFHLLALLDHLVNGVLFITDSRWMGWNYGFDLVRFVSPVTTSDRFRVEGLVRDIEPRGDGYVIVQECRLAVEGREKPGLTAVWRTLWALSEEDTHE